jgi:Na+-translocating ferredoxin:NAD+ oxidoreductase subunit G
VAVGSPASTSDTNDGVPATGVPTKGDVFLKSDEALKLAFPKAEVTKERTFLNKDQKARVAKLAGEDFDRAIINAYVARDDKGVLLGTAYFDNHKVRTKRETLMFVVDRAGKLTRIEVLAFGEPKEYMPSARWFAQLIGKSLTKGLSIKRDIKNLSGATLSAKATVAAARRVLATHQMLGELRLKRAEEAARKEALDKGKKDDDPATDPPKESPPNPEDPMPDVPTPKPEPTPPEDGEDPDGGGGAPGPTGIPYLSRSER